MKSPTPMPSDSKKCLCWPSERRVVWLYDVLNGRFVCENDGATITKEQAFESRCFQEDLVNKP